MSNVITSYSIHYTKLYEPGIGNRGVFRDYQQRGKRHYCPPVHEAARTVTILALQSTIAERKMATPKKFRILIIDDHPIFCLGMSELINKEADLEVCGSVELMKKAPEAINRLKPDLVIVDISLKDGNGIELVQELKKEYEGLRNNFV